MDCKSLILLQSGHGKYSRQILLLLLTHCDGYFVGIPLVDLEFATEAPFVFTVFVLAKADVLDVSILEL